MSDRPFANAEFTPGLSEHGMFDRGERSGADGVRTAGTPAERGARSWFAGFLTVAAWFLFTTAFLWLCFAKNLLHVVSWRCQLSFDSFDEIAMIKTIDENPYRTSVFSFELLSPEAGQPTGGDTRDNTNGLYVSAYGLPAMVFSRLRQALGAGLVPFVSQAKLVTALLLAATLAAFVASVASEFGAATAALVTVALGLSPWMVCMAVSLSWVAFLLFLPFVVTWILYPGAETRRRSLLFGAITILIAIRCLCNYAFLPDLVLSVAAPILYWGAAKARPLMRTGLDAAFAMAAAAAGIVLAMILHVTQLFIVFGREGPGILLHRLAVRSMGAGLSDAAYHFPLDRIADVLGQGHWLVRLLHSHPLLLGLYSFLWYMNESAVNLPGANAPDITRPGFLQIGVIAFVVVGMAWRRRRQLLGPGRENGLLLAACVGLVGALLWGVLMTQHWIIHVHMDTISFYSPFLLLAYVYLAALVLGRLGGREAYGLDRRRAGGRSDTWDRPIEHGSARMASG